MQRQNIKIATWNINSINARIDLLINWIKKYDPDIILLQEIKCLEKKYKRRYYEISLYGKGLGDFLIDIDDRLKELDRLKTFNFEDWRQRYTNWLDNKYGRITDLFRRQDKDGDGKITRKEFIDGILKSSILNQI